MKGVTKVDPARDEVFLWWIVDRVKELARDPQFIRDFEEWQKQREEKDPSLRAG